MKYEYFISYATKDGFGKCGLTRTNRIKTMTDITKIQEDMCMEFGYELVIIYYKLIRRTFK